MQQAVDALLENSRPGSHARRHGLSWAVHRLGLSCGHAQGSGTPQAQGSRLSFFVFGGVLGHDDFSRFDKLAKRYLGFLSFAYALIWLR